MNANPYHTPAAAGDRKLPFAMSESKTPLIAFLVLAVGYHILMIALLWSSLVDQRIGWIMMINTPVFMAWGWAIWLRSRHSVTGGSVAICSQIWICIPLICIPAFSQKKPDWRAVFICGITLIGMMLITYVCWKHRKIRDLPSPRMTTGL